MTKTVFTTRITELFQIRHPILGGGLMWLADANYVAALVNAGAMGFLTPRSFGGLEPFRAEIRKCRELTQGKPFGVNLYISARPEQNRELEKFIDILIEEGVAFVETAGYVPSAFLPRLKDAGCTVMHKVTTVRHARKAQAIGVDAVCLVGMECGGHPGLNEVPAFVLAARAAAELEIPFVVGGGIGLGRQITAALALGAGAVLVGTRMIVAEEIWAHEAYKRKLIEADETCSVAVLKSLRNTYRVLANETTAAVQQLEAEGVRDYQTLMPLIGGDLSRQAYATGDWRTGLLSAGPAAAFADEIAPAAEIIADLMADAARALDRLNGLAAAGAAAVAAE